MCGIGGWLGFHDKTEEVVSNMVNALHHRGPDGRGMWSSTEATLIHTRLSIIDLSPAGAQPITNEDGTVLTVFNGEIYNHRELRSQLERRGHRFKGRSDSEVLPHLYEEEGAGFIEKLRGMFALAIYDTRTRTLLLARDRFGIKPLFYAPRTERLAFASEINTLLALPDIERQPNRQAIFDFAALFYIPAPETFYSGIRALQAGELLEAQLDDHEVVWKTRRYHHWSITPDFGLTHEQAEERADALVSAAVRRQLESDVPLGALLSGGIDSSLVAVAAQGGLGGGLRTFSVRFSEKEYDETWAAEAVAHHIGSDHITMTMDGVTGSWDEIAGLLRHTGQPFADVSIFAVNAVSKLIRKHVAVALSGDGGDEGFGGYNLYWQIARIARWQTLPPTLWSGASMMLAPFGGISARVCHRLRELAGADDTSIIESLFCSLPSHEHQALCLDKDVLPLRRLFEQRWEHRLPKKVSRLERLSAHATEISTRLTLANDYLFKVDAASMKESLEVRVPMLDEELFAFGLTLPHNLKVRRRICKSVLRAVAQRRLPATVANKPKWGFSVPLYSWLDADFKDCLREVLLGDSSRLSEFFRPKAYRDIVECLCAEKPHPEVSQQGLWQRAIMLLSVQLMLGKHSSC